MKAIKEFWLSSYQSDKVAFYFELVSFVFIVGASMTMAITADNPDMRYIYGYFIGSLTLLCMLIIEESWHDYNVSRLFYNR